MRVSIAAALIVAVAAPLPVAAAPRIAFAVPPGPLHAVIGALGAQAGVSIGLSDARLAAIPVRGFAAHVSVETALARLLAGTGADFVRIDAGTYRIVARARSAAPPPPAIAAPKTPETPDVIVVTASKRDVPVLDYPGSVQTVDVDALGSEATGRGTDAVIDNAPTLLSTHLGPGRNKLFIRGIADSSFNGPSQSTVGEYLGDVRLNYSAPDPNLALYDVKSVEILEGPQGTLYGAGTLGGIVRIVPQAPALTETSGWLSAGGALTAGGAPSADGAAMLNLPIRADTIGLRVVAYGRTEGGYIDDPGRGISNINRTRDWGGRATLRIVPAANWTIDVGGVVQNIDSRDGQYDMRGFPALERRSVIAQPFDNDYSLASVVVKHDMGAASLVSASSIVLHDVSSTFDASPSAADPQRYVEDDGITLITNETRLSRRAANGGGWVLGFQVLHNRSRIARTLGPPGSEPAIAGTLNTVDDLALFGEGTLKLLDRLYVTGGGRLSYSHLSGSVIDRPASGEEVNRHELSVLPSAGLLWKATPRLSAYARYQEGYRPGGIAVQAGASQRFETDSVAAWEGGLRMGNPHDRLSAVAALSYAHWEDIQADLVATDGLPYTANIGSGHILALDVQAHWRPLDGATIDAALVVNHSRLDKPDAAFAGEHDATLPNVPNVIARLGGSYSFDALGRPIRLHGSARYVGRSRLGVGPLLDISQGRYLDTALGVAAPVGRFLLSLDATNLANARRNIFALGNPFGVTSGDQQTPLRPRTIRLGATIDF